jgi:hypothetical protein
MNLSISTVSAFLENSSHKKRALQGISSFSAQAMLGYTVIPPKDREDEKDILLKYWQIILYPFKLLSVTILQRHANAVK